MEIVDLITKIVAVPLAFFAIWKYRYDFVTGKVSKLREEQKYADEFLSAVKVRTDMHPLVLQKGYQAIAGDASLETDVSEYLLDQSNQPNALRNYVLGKDYLEFVRESGRSRIEFKKFYRNSAVRSFIKWVLFTAFVIFLLFAMSPFFIAGILLAKDGGPKTIFQLICLSVIFGLYAAVTVRKHIKLAMAEKLVERLEENIQKSQAASINLKLVSGDEVDQATGD